jgi:hypothetical protein
MADSKRFLLRLDPRLFEAIRRWAEDDLRSINGQIEYLLTDQARRAGRLPHRRTRAEPPETTTSEDEEGGEVASSPGAGLTAATRVRSHRSGRID